MCHDPPFDLEDMNTKKLMSLFTLVASATLLACGGGGGSAPATVAASQSPSPTTVSVTAAPIVSAAPTNLTFPLTAFGTTSAAMTETISNVGTADLVLTSANTTGPFRLTGGSCFTAGPVPPGGSCTALVTFTPTTHGTSPASNLTIVAKSLPDTVVPLVGTSPAAVVVTVGSKMYSLAYPPVIANLPDTDPSALVTDSTASLWSLVSNVSTFGSSTTPLPTPQLIALIPWPITFALWSKGNGGGTATAVTGNGCQIDLVGSNLVVTVNGESISAAVDGTPPVLYNGQVTAPGDVVLVGASERTVGVRSVVRRAEINAYSESMPTQSTQLALSAVYDSQGGAFGFPGIYGSLLISVLTPTSIKQYRCTDY